MSHMTEPGQLYSVLQKRLDAKVQRAPASPALIQILSRLYSPEDARLAVMLPHSFTSLETLSKNVGLPGDELADRLSDMARRGLVFDLEHKGRHFFTLPPVVVGFFELTFMRTRPDTPMKELACLFEEYFYADDRFAHSHYQGSTQLFRSFVREEALPEKDHTEVLDWERATHVVSTASAA